jgi:hypothetical protein
VVQKGAQIAPRKCFGFIDESETAELVQKVKVLNCAGSREEAVEINRC